MAELKAIIYSMSALMGADYEDEDVLTNTFELKKNDLSELRTLLGPRKWRSKVLRDLRHAVEVQLRKDKNTTSFPNVRNLARRVIQEAIHQEPSDDLVEDVLSSFNKLTTFELSDNVRNVIHTFWDAGIIQAIAANTIVPARYYSEKFTDLGYNYYFEAILSSADMGIRKPSPEFFEIVLDSLVVKPEEVIYIADNILTDIPGAIACGIKTILVNRYTVPPIVPKEVEIVYSLQEILEKIAIPT